ncbi:MAG: TonB-dependent receptor [Flavobacteriaceae bacterium]
MKFLMALLFTAACTISVNAQQCDGILLGEVVDFHDESPLSDARISIVNKADFIISDQNGKFSLKNLCDGVMELEVSHPECKTQFVTVEIKGDSFVRIALEHHLEELEEVSVTGDAIPDKTNSAQEDLLRSQDLERFGGASLGDALKQISGVSSLNTGANIVKPVIQGLSGSRVLILNNGVRMQDMEWGDEHAPNVDINATDQVTVIKGAAALKYGGDAIGGVVLLEKTPVRAVDSLFGSTSLTAASNGRGGTLTSELTKSFENGWYAGGQVSYKRLGDLEAPDYVLSNTGVSQLGASVNFGKRNFQRGWEFYYSYFDTEIAILRASHTGNVDDLIQAINSEQPNLIEPFTYDIQSPSQKVGHHLGKLNFYQRFKGVGKLSLQYDFQRNRRFEFDVRVGDDRNTPAIDLRLSTHTMSADFKLDSKSDYKLHFGLLGRYQENFANPDTGVRRLIPDYERYDFGAFITGEFFVSNEFILDTGLRFDFNRVDAQKFYRTSRWAERGYDVEFADIVVQDLGTQLLTNPVFNYENISFSAGLQYKPVETTALRFNYAMAQRAPNPSELFSDGLHHSAARIELGDLRIGSETSHKFSLALDGSSAHWGYRVGPYANFISDFILPEPTTVEFTIRGAFPVWGYRQTNARILGLDLTAYAKWHKQWRSDHQFFITKGTDTEQELPLINIPAANLRNTLTFTATDLHGLRVALESQYVFRQNEFPPNLRVFSPEQGQEVAFDINTPPEAYHLLGLDAEMQFNFFEASKLTAGLNISNLLDTQYRDYLNRQRYFADNLGRNISIRLKFTY